jgi:tRNA (guanosine-2'-O-)-methyltransferase
MAEKSSRKQLRQVRRARHGCWDHLVIAPLWVAYEANDRPL